jgi:hypothetical protein
MTPARLSSVLRSVADRLDRSKKPSKSAVSRELRRVLAAMATIKVTVGEEGETHTRFMVERDGVISSGLMPHDPDEDDIEDLVGDPQILRAATAAYDGQAQTFELTDEELEERGDGNWSAP